MSRGAISGWVLRKLLAVLIFVLPLSGFAASGFDPLPANEQTQAAIAARVKDVMHRFAVAVKKKDMGGFHGSTAVSPTLAKLYSVEKMNAAFKPLIDSGADLTQLDAMQPKIEGVPQIDTLNELIVHGGYSSTPPTQFEMRFVFENGRVGLSFIDVHVGDGAAAAATQPAQQPRGLNQEEGLPDQATLSALAAHGKAVGVQLPPEQIVAVRAAMHAFALGVKKKNMGDFLLSDIVSQRWREQQSVAQVDAAYRNTIAMGGDFTLLDPLVPVIPAAPILDRYGVLTISGYYDDPTARIGFKMGFVDEAGGLRLVNFAIVPGRTGRH